MDGVQENAAPMQELSSYAQDTSGIVTARVKRNEEQDKNNSKS